MRIIRVLQGVRNPIFLHEMRRRMRSPRAYGAMFVYLILLVVVDLFLVYDYTNMGPAWLTGMSRDMFVGISFAQLVLVLVLVPGMCAGAITLEREHQTLESLLLTPLRSWDVVLGKALIPVGFGLLLVLSSVPVLSLCFLIGGVSPWEMIGALAIISATLVVIVGLAILATTLAKRTAGAVALAYGLMLLLVPGMLLLVVLLTEIHSYRYSEGIAWIFVLSLAGASMIIATLIYGPILGIKTVLRPNLEIRRVTHLIAFGAIMLATAGILAQTAGSGSSITSYGAGGPVRGYAGLLSNGIPGVVMALNPITALGELVSPGILTYSSSNSNPSASLLGILPAIVTTPIYLLFSVVLLLIATSLLERIRRYGRF